MKMSERSKQSLLIVTFVQGFFLYTFYAFHVSEISEKLSFWVFGTEFSENLGGFGQKSKFLG